MQEFKNICRRHPDKLILFVILAFSLLGDSMLYAVLPAQAGIIGLSVGQVGILLSINRIIRFGSNFWAASIFRRFGTEIPFAGAVVAGTATTVLYGFHQGFLYLLAMRLIWGISYSLMRLKILVDIFSEDESDSRSSQESSKPEENKSKEGRLSGLFQSVTRTGGLAGMILGGFLAGGFNFTLAAYLLGAVSVVGAALLLYFYFRFYGGEVNDEEKGEVVVPEKSGLTSLLNLIRDPSFAALLAAGLAVHFTARGVINSSYGFYLNQLYGDEIGILVWTVSIAAVSGMVLSSRYLFDIVFSPFMGYLSDILDSRALLKIALIAQGILLFIFALVDIPLVVLLLPGAIFLLTSLLVVLLYVNTGKFTGYSLRSRMAGLTTAGDVGAALGPLALNLVGLGLPVQRLYILCALFLLGAAALYHRDSRPDG
ncbi:MFS transporter [Halarsenatibacter silvermanii]|uniref:Major Facilitator Superfamily protein n=1 Tax=Halarsenatibacter silvermanii TaxID=321763 RepID=A0A1G9H9T4_9FIRM|nr:MFS transporter [Halarsenatibacter silvermanii]SDL09726.1 Major Facilitator Superfamily protein [Halarsenatibacter silvermanii]